MTQEAVHVVVGEGNTIVGQSTQREEAIQQARHHYNNQIHKAELLNDAPPRPMVLCAEIPGAIVSMINSAALTGDTIRQLMEQGRITRHSGVTL